jgi:hypothetical protein
MNMPMLMAVNPTQVLALTELPRARIKVTVEIFACGLYSSARRENPLLDPNASGD